MPGTPADARGLALRLGIAETEVSEALKRLLRLELIDTSSGLLKRTCAPITTSRDRASASLRRHHKQMLERAAQSLDDVPVELRDIGSITMAIDVNKIAEAKERINEFKTDMSRLMEQANPNAVYNLGIQLFPLCKAGELK